MNWPWKQNQEPHSRPERPSPEQQLTETLREVTHQLNTLVSRVEREADRKLGESQ